MVEGATVSVDGCCSFHHRPHRSKFSIEPQLIELNAEALDPGAEMRLHLADVTGNGNRGTTAAIGSQTRTSAKPSKASPGAPELM